MARVLVLEVAHRLGLTSQAPLRGPDARAPETERLDLQPGEFVRVRSPEEIARTLDSKGSNRGLSFDREMLRYCGQTMRVKARVDHIIDETSGRMIHIKRDAIILEGGVCTGDCSTNRWFCPRQIHAYFREGWLERIEAPAGTDGVTLPIVTRSGSRPETSSPDSRAA